MARTVLAPAACGPWNRRCPGARRSSPADPLDLGQVDRPASPAVSAATSGSTRRCSGSRSASRSCSAASASRSTWRCSRSCPPTTASARGWRAARARRRSCSRRCWRSLAADDASPRRPSCSARGCSPSPPSARLGVGLYRAFGGERGDDPARMIARATLVLLVLVAALGAATGVGLIAALGGGAGDRRALDLRRLRPDRRRAARRAALADRPGDRARDAARRRVGRRPRSHRRRRRGALPSGQRVGPAPGVPARRRPDGRRPARLTLPAGATEVNVRVGVGEAVVHVPDGACVTTDADVGVGAVDAPERVGGGRATSTSTCPPRRARPARAAREGRHRGRAPADRPASNACA